MANLTRYPNQFYEPTLTNRESVSAVVTSEQETLATANPASPPAPPHVETAVNLARSRPSHKLSALGLDHWGSVQGTR